MSSPMSSQLSMSLPSRWLATAALIVIAAAPFGAGAQERTPERRVPSSANELRLSYAPVVRRATPAVVNVYAAKTVAVRNPLFDDPIFRHFFGEGGNSRPGGPTARSLGSGVLVDASGLVVTNYHVIEGMTDVRVALADKREFDAGIVLRDQRTDLVVLRLKGGENFPVMQLGDSDALEVGDSCEMGPTEIDRMSEAAISEIGGPGKPHFAKEHFAFNARVVE